MRRPVRGGTTPWETSVPRRLTPSPCPPPTTASACPAPVGHPIPLWAGPVRTPAGHDHRENSPPEHPGSCRVAGLAVCRQVQHSFCRTASAFSIGWPCLTAGIWRTSCAVRKGHPTACPAHDIPSSMIGVHLTGDTTRALVSMRAPLRPLLWRVITRLWGANRLTTYGGPLCQDTGGEVKACVIGCLRPSHPDDVSSEGLPCCVHSRSAPCPPRPPASPTPCSPRDTLLRVGLSCSDLRSAWTRAGPAGRSGGPRLGAEAAQGERLPVEERNANGEDTLAEATEQTGPRRAPRAVRDKRSQEVIHARARRVGRLARSADTDEPERGHGQGQPQAARPLWIGHFGVLPAPPAALEILESCLDPGPQAVPRHIGVAR